MGNVLDFLEDVPIWRTFGFSSEPGNLGESSGEFSGVGGEL